jgi:hypothetical protein
MSASGFLLFLLFAVSAYYAIQLVRSTLSKTSAELRHVVQELKRARAAAADGARALRSSDGESAGLRRSVAALTADAALHMRALARAEEDLRDARAEEDVLRARLAGAEARCEELSDAVEKASHVSWEIASKYGSNEGVRVAALNNLRRPPERFGTILSESRAFAKSPSESHILSMRPDLSVSDSDDSDDDGPAFNRSVRERERAWEREAARRVVPTAVRNASADPPLRLAASDPTPASSSADGETSIPGDSVSEPPAAPSTLPLCASVLANTGPIQRRRPRPSAFHEGRLEPSQPHAPTSSLPSLRTAMPWKAPDQRDRALLVYSRVTNEAKLLHERQPHEGTEDDALVLSELPWNYVDAGRGFVIEEESTSRAQQQ